MYSHLKKILPKGKIMIYLFSVIIDLGFSIWTSFGKPWHIYFINFILLFIASSIINTSYIQGLTRGVSYIVLYKLKGLSKALRVNTLTIILMSIAYIITRFVFLINLQYILFFIACIALSTIVAFIDNQFQVAVERTRRMEGIIEKINRIR